jgi:dipeptidyl aminopeptidase/acylaminoacyl peptidase
MIKEEFMKRFLLIAVLISSVVLSAGGTYGEVTRVEWGNLVIEEIPEIPKRIKERMRQYRNTRSASIQGWLPGGKGMLISTRFGETSQIHLLEKPGGARRQITFFEEPVGGAVVCPAAVRRGFIFAKDVGGGEFYQLFYFDMDTGSYDMFTDGSSRNGGAVWSNDGKKFAFYSTRRNGRDWDIFVGDIDDPSSAEPIVEEGGVWFPGEWSPGDDKMIVGRYVSANESYGYVLDVESGELTEVNPTDKKVSYGSAVWAGDEGHLYFTDDQGDQFHNLKYYDIEKEKTINLTSGIHWDVGSLEMSEQGDRLAFTVNEDGVDKLYILDTKDQEWERVPGIPTGQIYGLDFHPDGSKLALVINTSSSPGDVYVLDMDDYTLRRWTYSEVGGLNTNSFVQPELIHYQTFDKVDGQPRKIPAFIYRPRNAQSPCPVLVYIHGGPEGQFVPYFLSTFQYYVNELGIAVIAPNVRGSAGYGKSYLKLDNGYKREDSVCDIGKLLDWIDQQPNLDNTRVAVIGGSYGGYMSLACMTNYNDRLKCGIDMVGISNFVTFLENTKEYRRDLRRVEYGDERDPDMREFLNRISPTTNAHKITKPMFIAQGLNDPRVPASEAEQIIEAVRSNGVTAWYMLAKDEGHGFRKKSNRDFYSHSVVLFLEKFLLE